MQRIPNAPRPSRRSSPLLVAALVLATGCGGADTVGSTSSDRDAEQAPRAQERDWDARRGEAWDAYADAFAEGWDAGCANTVRLGGGSSLSSDEGSVDATACVEAKRTPTDADAPREVPDDPTAFGREDGELFACEAVFDQLALEIGSDGTLTSGDGEFSRSNCPAEGDGIAPARAAPTATTPARAEGRIVDCPPFDLDGELGAAGFGFSDVSARNLSCAQATGMLVAQVAEASFEDAVLPGGMACERTARTEASPARPAQPAPGDTDPVAGANDAADRGAEAGAGSTPAPKARPATKAVEESTSYRCANEEADPPTAIRFTLG